MRMRSFVAAWSLDNTVKRDEFGNNNFSHSLFVFVYAKLKGIQAPAGVSTRQSKGVIATRNGRFNENLK